MLETTFSNNFVPGTNLTGGLARAPWRFLLPNLELDCILCLGVPSTATLSVLSTMSKKTLVVSTNAQQLDTIKTEIEQQAMANVQATWVNDFNHLPVPDKSTSLIFPAGKREVARILHHPSLPAELGRVLQDDGVIYLEVKNLPARLAARKLTGKLTHFGFKAPRVLWLTPLGGELRTAFPVDDDRMARYLFSHVLFGQSFKKRALSHGGVLLSRARLLRLVAPRCAILLPKSSQTNGELHAPPHYLHALAEKSGVDLSGLRCGLSARGKFNANKTIFYLFDRQGEKANAVVKMTRAPEFNHRLENEYRVLSLLHERGFVAPGTFPEPLFFGYHANLAVCGQKAVHGEPFRRRTKATVECPMARDAINWIVQLGAASSNRAMATAAEVGETLTKLFRHFAEIYPLSSLESDFLLTQIKGINRISKQFPLVFQHGDPGTWNMLVSEDDRVIVIDWEAGEPQGMPLWDLFYFLRTYCSWMARVKGEKDSLTSFTRQFLEPSPLHDLLVATTSRYCAHTGLEADWVAPLFHTCWMHRGLKESTRLTPATLARGHYFNLLRLCIARRDSAALSSLFFLNCKA